MRLATLEELARDPVGRYVAGETFAHFCVTPALWGVLLWGRPDMEHARALGRSLVLELAPEASLHGAIVDATGIEGADGTAFTALEWYVGRHAERLREKVARLALVRPSGLEGAIVAGVFDVLDRPYPVRVFSDVEAGLAWLAEATDLGAPPARVLEVLAELRAATQDQPPIVAQLRALLDARLDLEIGDAARALGLSERTLQRRLGEAGTSFVHERGASRVRVAQRMLRDGDAALTTVALEVGCASLQHFSALFRRVAGETPSAWREKHRPRRGR